MRLTPLLATPTPDSRERFLRVAHANGFRWSGNVLVHSAIERARTSAHYSHAYLFRDNIIAFSETLRETKICLTEGHVMVNSPEQFVRYAKSQGPMV